MKDDVFQLTLEPKFDLGILTSTPAINLVMHQDESFRDFVKESFERYTQCDWGDTCEEDKEVADEGAKTKGMILAVYIHKSSDKKIWIVTDYGHEVTTILFPEEY